MTYVIGTVAGLLFGGIIGLLKNLLVWNKYLKNTKSKEQGADPKAVGSVYVRAMISYFVNVAALFAAFLMRNVVPFHWMTFLIGTAIALAVLNHIWALKQKS